MHKLGTLIVFGAVFAPVYSSSDEGETNERDFIVGSTEVELTDPKSVVYFYDSKLFDGETIRLEYSGINESFSIFKNQEEIRIKDAVFSELKVSPYSFDLKEYLQHLGTDADPLKCQTVYFGVVDHELIVAGNYQMCFPKKPILRLQSSVSHPLEELLTVYDSSVSSEIHVGGFWEEIDND